MANFIFLTGSELRPLSWQKIQNQLDAYGQTSSIVDSADVLWNAGFSPAIDGLVEAISPSSHTVLVGHSIAGIILPLLGDRLDAICEIYIAALTQDPGQSFLDRMLEGEEVFDPKWIAGYEGLIRSEDPLVTHHFFLRDHLFHDCPSEAVDLFWRKSGLPLDVFYGATLPSSKFSVRRQHYIVCADDRTIRPAWQRLAAHSLPCADVTEIAGGHCPHIANPEGLARRILAITSASAPRARTKE